MLSKEPTLGHGVKSAAIKIVAVTIFDSKRSVGSVEHVG